MELYHSSPEILTQIKAYNAYSYVDFGGVFVSESKNSALSHHDNLHTIEIDEDEILTQRELRNLDVAEFVTCDRMYEIVVEEDQVTEEDVELFKAEDLAQASWKAQAIRGKIAKKYGYKAVEMNDEHGTSYLVLAGTEIKFTAE